MVTVLITNMVSTSITYHPTYLPLPSALLTGSGQCSVMRLTFGKMARADMVTSLASSRFWVLLFRMSNRLCNMVSCCWWEEAAELEESSWI